MSKNKQPTRANPAACWWCGFHLAKGGWIYRVVTGQDGHEHPVHVACVKGASAPEVTARVAERG